MTKQVKAIELLEVVTEMEIPKVQRDQKFKGTSKKIRKVIVELLEEYKANTDANGGDVTAAKKLINDYKDNKVTNEQIAEIVKKSFITEFKTMMAEAFPTDSMEDKAKDFIVDIVDEAAETYFVQAVKNKTLKDIDQSLLIEQVIEKVATSDKFKKKFGDVTANEIVYGAPVKKGEGYDHILNMSVGQLQQYQTVSSI